MTKFNCPGLLLLGLIMFNFTARSQSGDKDSILFYTQQLIDGIAAGNTNPWNKYLDESCIITSENGSVKTKQEFIKGIGVPPAYFKISETIVNPIFKLHDNVIIFCFTADLLLETFGQTRLTEICQTDTWMKTDNQWRLISEESLDKPNFPVTQKVTAQIIKEITGKYQLTDTVGYRVFQDSGRLWIQRFGGKKSELMCESEPIFFLIGNPLLRYIFVHNNDDKIVQLNVRRAGRDLIFPKVE
jgi:hypothetical protein